MEFLFRHSTKLQSMQPRLGLIRAQLGIVALIWFLASTLLKNSTIYSKRTYSKWVFYFALASPTVIQSVRETGIRTKAWGESNGISNSIHFREFRLSANKHSSMAWIIKNCSDKNKNFIKRLANCAIVTLVLVVPPAQCLCASSRYMCLCAAVPFDSLFPISHIELFSGIPVVPNPFRRSLAPSPSMWRQNENFRSPNWLFPMFRFCFDTFFSPRVERSPSRASQLNCNAFLICLHCRLRCERSFTNQFSFNSTRMGQLNGNKSTGDVIVCAFPWFTCLSWGNFWVACPPACHVMLNAWLRKLSNARTISQTRKSPVRTHQKFKSVPYAAMKYINSRFDRESHVRDVGHMLKGVCVFVARLFACSWRNRNGKAECIYWNRHPTKRVLFTEIMISFDFTATGQLTLHRTGGSANEYFNRVWLRRLQRTWMLSQDATVCLQAIFDGWWNKRMAFIRDDCGDYSSRRTH